MSVLDYKVNPFNNNAFSDEYYKLKEKWDKLPAYKESKKYTSQIKDNSVILVRSGTGSGKTVLFPKYALHVTPAPLKVIVTLPKRIVTEKAAEYSAKTLDVALGKEVGYQYKGAPSNSKSSDTRLLYSTDGSIISMIMKDPLLSDIGAIVIDEAHERKINIDYMLYLLRNILGKRDDFKVIIMSATIDNKIFLDYFKGYRFITIDIQGGSNYPIEEHYIDVGKTDKIVDKGVDIVVKIIEKGTDMDILFFVPTIADTISACNKLAKRLNRPCESLYSGVTVDPTKSEQRLFVSTNVAESSLTLPNIGYVIDSGVEIRTCFVPERGAEEFKKEWITNSQRIQRIGRAGRTAPGTAYHLYKKEVADSMIQYPIPEILCVNLVGICLQLIVNGFTVDVLNDFISPPPDNAIGYARDVLINHGYVVSKYNKLTYTRIGELVNAIPVKHYMAKAMVYAYPSKCFNELLIITCMCEVINYNIKNLYSWPVDTTDAFKDKVRKRHCVLNSDHITLLYLFNIWRSREPKDRVKWCKSQYISNGVMRDVQKMIRQVNPPVMKMLSDIDYAEYVNGKFTSKDVNTRVLNILYVTHNDRLFGSDEHKSIDKSSFVSAKRYKQAIYSEAFIISDNRKYSIVSVLKDVPATYDAR